MRAGLKALGLVLAAFVLLTGTGAALAAASDADISLRATNAPAAASAPTATPATAPAPASAPISAPAPAAGTGLQLPRLTGRVVDDAHILTGATVSDLTAKLAALEMKTSRQLVVVTVPSLQGYEIEEYSNRLFRAWGVGQKGINNGILLVVAPNERRVRIEVGYGMEGVVTDALSSVILQTEVLPKFKAGDMPAGVVAGADALIEQMSADPSTAEKKLADAAAAQARGGGERSPGSSPVALLFVLVFMFVIIRMMTSGRGGGGGGGAGWIAPVIIGGLSGLGGGRRDDWGGGGGFGGGGGGGGFSGGGGSSGGGGASGGW